MSDINTPEDLLRAARVPPITIANCAECRHSQLDHTFKNVLVRICNAHGGRSCSIVNAEGNCPKFQQRTFDEALSAAMETLKESPRERIDPFLIVTGVVVSIGLIGFFIFLTVLALNTTP